METKLYKKTFAKRFNNELLLFNAFNNETAVIPFKGSVELSIENHREYLISNNVIYEDLNIYKAIGDYFINSTKYSLNTITITDCPWFSCNLRCIYCMQQNTPSTIKYLKFEDRFKVWKSIANLSQAENINVCLFGGEPFLYPTYTKNLLNLCLKDDNFNLCSISTVTNGTLINPEIIDLINTYNILTVQITLDGPEKVHNSRRISPNKKHDFTCIMKSILTLLQFTNTRIFINTVLDKSNCNFYIELIEFITDKFSKYCFNSSPRIVFNLGNECEPYCGCEYTTNNSLIANEDLSKYNTLLEYLINKGVAINSFLPSALCIRDQFFEFVVGPDGSLFNCISGIGLNEHLICNKDTLISNPDLALSLLAYSKRSIKDINCDSCIYYGMCNGGCTFDRLNNPNRVICQKNKFNQTIDVYMKLIYECDEISDNIWMKRVI